ncbi:sirohydrochlorin ferrochelatase [Mycobacterium kyorinense]|uniref:Sirohydrochlorin ferrochelatase n=1 Tax=Mycobacterium kyorinense TaxID=487514 RepID=A0A1A2YZ62_9MYCO|nr:sirohydrochlorin chelatase [Mycobacterium kyorinense]OBI43564.1 sirohydrochlorin ferrochelatase [Mycobacterium kyorinense]
MLGSFSAEPPHSAPPSLRPPLVLTAHGSADPRSAANARAVAALLRRMRPGLDVRVAFCEQNSPMLADVVTPGSVVTPFLLADAYHARIDIPRQIAGRAGVRQAEVLGEDDRLIAVLRERLRELGVSGLDHDLGVLVVAIGSSDAAANARTVTVAARLAASTSWAGATTAFATAAGSLAEAADRLQDAGARRLVIAPWFLAPGRLTDRVADFAHDRGIAMAAPLGAHPLVAQTVLDRFDAALTEQAAA